MARRSKSPIAQRIKQLESPRIKALHEEALRALQLGAYEQAEDLISKALAIAPDLAPLLATRARALVRMSQYDKAEADIGEALSSWPNPPPLWYVTLSLVHRGRGELDKAVRVLEDARKDFPAAQAILSTLTELYITLRKHDLAYAMLHDIIARHADRPGVFVQYGRICRIKGCAAEAIEPLSRVVGQRERTVSERKRAAFELGMVFDSLGRYDEAFDAFATANALETRVFDIELHSQLVDQVCCTWTRERLAKMPVADIQGQGVVLLVGMRRSGSTLCEQILASHSKVAAGGELPWLRRAAQPVYFGNSRMQGLIVSLEKINQSTLNQVGQAYMERVVAARSEKAFFTDKLPANYELLGLAQLTLPGVRVVWCKRDPLNTCLSCFMQPFNDNSYCADLRMLARYYHDCMRLMKHWQEQLDIPIHEAQYERIVENPEAQVREMLSTLGLNFEPGCLRFYETKRAPRTVSTDQVAKKIYTSSLDRAARYRAHLEPLIDELERLGYEV